MTVKFAFSDLMELPKNEKVQEWSKSATRLIDKVAGRMNADNGIEGDYFDSLDEKIGRGPIRFGLWTIIVVFGSFFIWASFAPLSTAAVATGNVVLDTDKKTIQHLEGGIIDQILVHEGDYVEAGQALVRLSETAAKARADLLAAQYYSEKAASTRLMAERDGLDTLTFPEELVSKAKESEKVAEILDSQKRLFEARNQSLAGQIGILGQRKEQLDDEIDGLQAQEKSSKDQLALLNDEISVVSKLVSQGNAARPRLLALQRQAAEVQGRQGEYIAMIARARQTINETELEIINARNEYLNRVVAELREVQVKLSTLEEQVRASADILDRIIIAAPQSGIVTGLRFHTKGGVIAPGAEIMDIIPQDERLIVEAHVNPNDIDIVHRDLPARVRLSAYKTRNIPPLEGVVKTISADRFVNPSTQQAYYLARIVIDEAELASVENVALYPGMPAEVLIVTGERTLLSYLTSPIRDAMFRAFKEQ